MRSIPALILNLGLNTTLRSISVKCHKRRSRVRVCVAAAICGAAIAAGAAGQNAVPQVNQPLVPAAAQPGSRALMLTVSGAGFADAASVFWNGSPRSTTYVTASISASDLAAPGTASVTVVNPAPGGGTSNVVFFQITNPTSAASLSASGVPTGLSPLSVVSADFDADGHQDLAVANQADDTASILLGNGDGTFESHIDYPTGLGPNDIALGDFNRDGRLDLAVVNGGENSSGEYANSVSILLGNGDGTFQPHVDYSTGELPVRVVAGDFNGDGNLDLAVANQLLGTVSILLGNGDGTFQPHVDYSAGGQPMALSLADFNRDGRLDLAVANFAVHTVSILLGNGDGTFQGAIDYNTSPEPDAMLAADFNGDGVIDLAAAEFGSSAVAILLGSGDGTFQKQVLYSTGPYPESLAAGDFNGDGLLDLALATDSGLGSVSVLLGRGDGTFQAVTNFPAGLLPVETATGDFNGDGMLDVASADLNANLVSALLETTLQLSPQSLTFANQTLGTTSNPQTVTLTNLGSTSLSISSIGTSAPFAVSANTCGTSLAAGAKCTANVTFTPTVPGTSDGSLTVTDGAVGSPQVVALSGTGSGPTVSLSPGSLDFGDQIVGTSSAGQTVTLTNTGNAALTINSISTTGDYSDTNNCGTSVEAGGNCTIIVSFTPTTTGTRTGTLSVADNALNSPQSVSLTGVGIAPIVTLSPTSLTFPVQLVGTTSPSQPVTLTNSGTAPLTINQITAAPSFPETDTCPRNPSTLGVGSSCTLNISFAPASSGLLSASVLVNDNAPGSPQKIGCTGTGTVVLLSPLGLNFGIVNLGQSSSPQTVTLTNVGTTTLTISYIKLTGTNPGDFSVQTNTCGSSVGPGGSCNVSVVFTPMATGLRSASLSFYDNGGNSPQSVSLTGTGN